MRRALLALPWLLAACFSPPPQGPDWDDARGITGQTLQGCQHFGEQNRFGVRGEVGGLCATLLLVQPGQSESPFLVLPDEMGVQAQSLVAGSCQGRSWLSPHEPEREVTGTVEWAQGAPGSLDVDVRFPTGTARPQWVRLVGRVVVRESACL
jgi:hypothetical protein